MLRPSPRTHLAAAIALAASLGAAAGVAAPASAFENTHYRGSVDAPWGAWGPSSERSTGKTFVLDLTLSLPKGLNERVGTSRYAAVGGVTVCRGTPLLAEIGDSSPAGEGRFGDFTLAEKRVSPSIRRTSKRKRAAVRSARKWCRSGAWRMRLFNANGLLDPATAAASDTVNLYPSPTLDTYELTRRP